MKRILLGILVIALLVAIVLYATGYWSANVQEGSLPSVDVSAQGGSLPKIDLDSNIVVGTKETTVDAPGVQPSTVEVPTIGVESQTAPVNQQSK